MQVEYEIVSIIFFILSFLAFPLFLTIFTHKQNLAKLGNIVLWLAFICNIFSIYFRIKIIGNDVLFDFSGPVLISIGILLLAYLIIDKIFKISVMGAFIAPACFLASGYLIFFNVSAGKLLPHFKNALIAIHIIVILLSFIFFALAFFSSLLYLKQEKLLKTKKKGNLLKKLPSLKSMETFSFHTVSLGLVLLTLGLLSGGIVSRKIANSFNILSPKGILTIFTWLLYASYVILHFIKLFPTKKNAYLLVAGFIIIIITYFGTGHGLKTTP